MNGSSVAKLLLGVVLALAGLGMTIGITTGHITIIFGSHNKVDHRDQSGPAQPTRPIAAEVPREQPAAGQPTQAPVEPYVATADISQPTELAHARRPLPETVYEDEECTCPVEEEDEGEEVEEVEPESVPVRIKVQPQTVYASALSSNVSPYYAQSQSQSSRVYVQGGTSVSVSSSASSGQRPRTRIIVNGQVVVDE